MTIGDLKTTLYQVRLGENMFDIFKNVILNVFLQEKIIFCMVFSYQFMILSLARFTKSINLRNMVILNGAFLKSIVV